MTQLRGLDDLDIPTGDEMNLPVDYATLGAIIVALGGSDVVADVTGPQKLLPLRLGDIDLGRWKVAGIRMLRRAEPYISGGSTHIVTLRRVVDR